MAVLTKGEFHVDRGITSDPRFKELSHAYKVLHYVLQENLWFQESNYDVFGINFHVGIDQYVNTHEEIRKLCGEETSSWTIENGLELFHKYGWYRIQTIILNDGKLEVHDTFLPDDTSDDKLIKNQTLKDINSRRKKTLITYTYPRRYGKNRKDDQTIDNEFTRRYGNEKPDDTPDIKEALASLDTPSKSQKEKKQQQNDDVRGVVVSITEGWKYLSEELKRKLDNVCYVVLDENKSLLEASELVAALQILGLSDLQVYELRDKFKFPVERIILAIAYVRSAHIHTSIMGTIIEHCQAENPWPPKTKTKKQKLRRFSIDPVEASKASFGEGSIRIPQWMLDSENKKAN